MSIDVTGYEHKCEELKQHYSARVHGLPTSGSIQWSVLVTGRSVLINIHYCPLCGATLPPAQADLS